eukprot:2173248-Alexandrium_andersonii.AAC.1
MAMRRPTRSLTCLSRGLASQSSPTFSTALLTSFPVGMRCAKHGFHSRGRAERRHISPCPMA